MKGSVVDSRGHNEVDSRGDIMKGSLVDSRGNIMKGSEVDSGGV